jgi:hypothetical protein
MLLPGRSPVEIVQPHVIQSAPIRRAIVMSMLAHAAVLLVGWWALEPDDRKRVELVDIEVAPPPPKVEALPAEIAKVPEQVARAEEDEVPAPPEPADEPAIDAGIDAAPEPPPDAAPEPPEPPDAGAMVAIADAAPPVPEDAAQLAIVDPWQGSQGEGSAGSATGSGSGSAVTAGSGSGSAVAAGSGSGSAVAGLTTDPAVEGAETTAGTAANLLTYFPNGHITTLLIRFDRLRGTEWAQQTERLLRPMPDYHVLFGAADARIAEKLDTIVISTPQPGSAIATTLVARTRLQRAALRGFLAAANPVAWSASRGGLLGRRGGKLFPQDARVFLSPFKSWFLLAQPADLPGLLAASKGDLDQIEASGKLPAWLAGIRAIEAESGEPSGPALVMTLALDEILRGRPGAAAGHRMNLGDNDFGLGVKSFPLPDRFSLAAEVVTQGWLVRGNIRFATDAAAGEFVAAAESARQRIADSRLLQSLVGKPAARVITNLSFARSGPRVSYATSISIADMRAIMAVAAQQLDAYFAARRLP